MSWAPQLNPAIKPKYLAIIEALKADIQSGAVRVGDRLPPQRALADLLGVDLTTVTRAFNEARRLGLIDAHVGRGSFIRGEAIPETVPAVALDLSMNSPPHPAAANLEQRITNGIADLLRRRGGMSLLHYQDAGGSEGDRTAAAGWLAPRMGALAPYRITVTSGAQAALYAVCAHLLQPGDCLAIPGFTYPGVKSVADRLGVYLLPLAMDEVGILPDSFEAACKNRRPKALYLVPTIDNPTTATLPEARRVAIVALARRHGVAIIEDDPYSPLAVAPPPAFLSLAPELTWHLATLSKCATPSLRIAYCVCPTPMDAQRIAAVLRATNLMAPPLFAALASRWSLNGALGEITTAIRAENQARHALAAEVLAPWPFFADPVAPHLWLPLSDGRRAGDFADHARRLGLAIVPGGAFAAGIAPTQAVRISLGVASGRTHLQDALTLLADLLAQPPLSRTVV